MRVSVKLSSASNSGTKKILDVKDGIRKFSFTAYHLKVMRLLADKGLFGKAYRPYEKRYQRIINSAIAAVSGDDHGAEVRGLFTRVLSSLRGDICGRKTQRFLDPQMSKEI